MTVGPIADRLATFESAYRLLIESMAQARQVPPRLSADDLYQIGLTTLWEALESFPKPDVEPSDKEFLNYFWSSCVYAFITEIRGTNTQKRNPKREVHPDQELSDAAWDNATQHLVSEAEAILESASYRELLRRVKVRLAKDPDAFVVFCELSSPSLTTRECLLEHSLTRHFMKDCLPYEVIATSLTKQFNRLWTTRQVEWCLSKTIRPIVKSVFGFQGV